MTISRWTSAAAAALVSSAALVAAGLGAPQQAQQPPAGQTPQGAQAAPTPPPPDDIRTMVSRLELEKYKATIKGLTQFGDRRQGTKRNRDAVDWIEAQLKSYGCTNTERITYTHPSPEAADPARGRGAGGGGQGRGRGGQAGAAAGEATGGPAAGGAAAGAAGTGAATTGAGAGTGRAGGGGAGAGTAGAAATAGAPAQPGRGGGGGGGRGSNVGPLAEPVRNSSGGSTLYGNRARTGVYNPESANAAPLDPRLRALNAEPTTPGERQEVYCTKIGTTRPDEMYILGAHMDGHGWGEAANDDGSGTALVMELARVFSSPDVTTERSIRFILWNNEETGLNGAWAYVNQRKDLQGKENPPGSGKYPEPKWLGMVQHDMMMWDHGMPRADGTVSPDQRPEADVNIEWQSNSQMAEASMKLALALKLAADRYTTDYPATLGPHMTNTDSGPFMNFVAAISLRENERGMHTGSGWNPTWHQPIDVYTTFSDKDFKLGLNAAQTTLSGIAQLTGAKVKK